MRRENLASACGLGKLLGACGVLLLVATRVDGQTEPPPRIPPFVPPAWGTTPLSAQIHAEAGYIAAQGGFLVDASIAARHREFAREHRINNYRLWVETYFDTRALWRAYRLEENPNFLMREETRQKVKQELVTKFFQHTLKGDVTEELNWLLRELSGPALAMQYLPENQSLADKGDVDLTERDAFHIRLSDGRLAFRAPNAEVLQTQWPLALRAPKFNEVREHFETSRDEVLKEISSLGPEEQLSYESSKKLMDAVALVATALNDAYPLEKRKKPATFVEYIAGERYVQTLLAGVYRAIETNDRWLFDGSYEFKGDSVVDLIQHMYQNGLIFAAPETGDKGTYQKLFLSMRDLYVSLTEEKAIPGGGNF